MSECFAVSLDRDGYQFSAGGEQGDIHVLELTDVAAIRSVNIEEFDPAKIVLSNSALHVK